MTMEINQFKKILTTKLKWMVFWRKSQSFLMLFRNKIQRPPLVMQRKKIKRALMMIQMKIQLVLAPMKKLLSQLRRKLLFKFVIIRAKMVSQVRVLMANALKETQHPKKCLS